jgi:hypothetical protein
MKWLNEVSAETREMRGGEKSEKREKNNLRSIYEKFYTELQIAADTADKRR